MFHQNESCLLWALDGGWMQVGSSHFKAKLSPFIWHYSISHSFWTERGIQSDPKNGTFGRAELFWKPEASHSNGLPVKCETSTSCPSASDVPSTDCYKNVAQNLNWFLPCLHSNNYDTIMKWNLSREWKKELIFGWQWMWSSENNTFV